AAEYAPLPESLVVREVRFRVQEPGRGVRTVTLVTTLRDPRRYSARALQERERSDATRLNSPRERPRPAALGRAPSFQARRSAPRSAAEGFDDD
ncbi:MAG TPA: hypothetical protein VNK04_13865, partial [Gemmataceae bacterium]|nr:hypothetical protein [Gemmataceae bacterium]